MRLRFQAVFLAGALALPLLRAQNPQTISPEASTAKAKTILEQMIEALGGRAYLTLRDEDCTGRQSQFGLAGDMMGYMLYHEYRILPDKQRVEYTKKSRIIDIYNGDQGWTLDKAGVDEIPAADAALFQAQLKTGLNNLLRYRLAEPDLYFRYAGTDVVDLKPADWIEITDGEDRTFRIAVDQSTHLPLRNVLGTRNPRTGENTQETTIYAEWHLVDGVATPFQVWRDRDGKRVFQSFLLSCKYNSGLSPDLFTRASLEQKWATLGHKPKNQKN